MINYIIATDEQTIEFLKKNAAKITGDKKVEVVVETISSLYEVENAVARAERAYAARNENKDNVDTKKRRNNNRKHTT